HGGAGRMSRRPVVVVTGGSAGIGLAAAVELARRGAEVVLLGRHEGRLAGAVRRVGEAAGGRTPRAYRADFADLAQVREVAGRLAADLERIDVLVNNAGLLAPRPGARSVDGFDLTMQVNHLAGFLLAHRLRDRLRRPPGEPPGRLITTGSVAEAWGSLDPDDPGRPRARYRSRWLAYGASKQANLLFTVGAARRWAADGIVPTCVFPGLVRSRFAPTSPLFTVGKLLPVVVTSPRQGADTIVWLASDGVGEPGGYYYRRSPFPATPRAQDPARADRLWRATLHTLNLPPEPPEPPNPEP
ncbi:MAG TPA: SDR family NAD(P)-dependent oxidoreductase, partial [Pilimelia sp.]|nr:SDR family NAD(P)-dependent oxidoreductase [Pilimelia sp.]